MGFVVECGFLVENFLVIDLVLDLISRKWFRHVKSTKGLSCHGNTSPHHTTSHHTKPFPVEPLREPCASFHRIHLPQSFHPFGQSAQTEILGCTCFPINALSRQKRTRPGSSFAILAIENLLQPHRISA
jgi:hypothetical protein